MSRTALLVFAAILILGACAVAITSDGYDASALVAGVGGLVLLILGVAKE